MPGSTARPTREMKELAEKEAKLFRLGAHAKAVRVAIDKDREQYFETKITKAFLTINDLLDKIDAKYNALISGGAPPSGGGGGPFAGTGALSGGAAGRERPSADGGASMDMCGAVVRHFARA